MIVKIPSAVTEEFIKVANANLDHTGRPIETLAFLIGHKETEEVVVCGELLFPSQTGDCSKVDDEGTHGLPSEWWIMRESSTAKQHGTDNTVLAAWIHTHVRGVKCGFSSVDVHTQYAYSHDAMYPNIMGHVVELCQDGSIIEDFFTLTAEGKAQVSRYVYYISI